MLPATYRGLSFDGRRLAGAPPPRNCDMGRWGISGSALAGRLIAPCALGTLGSRHENLTRDKKTPAKSPTRRPLPVAGAVNTTTRTHAEPHPLRACRLRSWCGVTRHHATQIPAVFISAHAREPVRSSTCGLDCRILTSWHDGPESTRRLLDAGSSVPTTQPPSHPARTIHKPASTSRHRPALVDASQPPAACFSKLPLRLSL